MPFTCLYRRLTLLSFILCYHLSLFDYNSAQQHFHAALADFRLKFVVSLFLLLFYLIIASLNHLYILFKKIISASGWLVSRLDVRLMKLHGGFLVEIKPF